MANRSYLCATDLETIYPSLVDPTYDLNLQTIAQDVWCIPLLWIALFRDADIVERTFDVDGDEIYAEAPLAQKELAIKQLRASIPYFNSLFSDEGPLDEYARLFEQAIQASPYTFVTIEMEEIAVLFDDPQQFYDMFREALASIGKKADVKTKSVFSEIAQFRNLQRFPPASLGLDDGLAKKATDDDMWNHCRVLGTRWGPPVPWEPN